MKVAYVRVSTVEQNEARQVEALEKHDIEKVDGSYFELESGVNNEKKINIKDDN